MKSLIVAGVVFVAAIVGSLYVLSRGNESSIFDAEVGDCFMLPIDGDETAIESIAVIDCGEPHDAQIVAAGELNADGDAEYPPSNELFARIDAACPDPTTYAVDGFGIVPVAPNEQSWEGQGGAYACIAITISGGTVTESLFD